MNDSGIMPRDALVYIPSLLHQVRQPERPTIRAADLADLEHEGHPSQRPLPASVVASDGVALVVALARRKIMEYRSPPLAVDDAAPHSLPLPSARPEVLSEFPRGHHGVQGKHAVGVGVVASRDDVAGRAGVQPCLDPLCGIAELPQHVPQDAVIGLPVGQVNVLQVAEVAELPARGAPQECQDGAGGLPRMCRQGERPAAVPKRGQRRLHVGFRHVPPIVRQTRRREHAPHRCRFATPFQLFQQLQIGRARGVLQFG